ncbi:MAG: hypothetical protein HOM61_02800, partial [Candidatus Marinimicrobia bacterium]|nr:hypothetical protein [Candidatus Neomarinimicrobiota bacterium]
FSKIQNLLGSHDTERIASACANPDRWIDHANNLNYNPEFNIRKPNQTEYELQKQIITFQFMFPGTPYIFYGDEVGMWGADDPDSRKPMIWPEFQYENESVDPFGNIRKSDNVSVNQNLFTHYQILIQLRKKYSALRRGNYEMLYAENEIFAFSRKHKKEQIISIFNASNFHQEFSIDSLNLDGESQSILLLGSQGSLPPHSYSIYEIK